MQELYDDDAAGHHRASGGVRHARRLHARRGRRRRRLTRAQLARRSSRRARLRAATGSTACSWSCSPTARRCASRARSRETRLPVCLANVQPVPEVTSAWDMGDLTYNQGIHGAQDTANAMVRAGRPFDVITGDWQAASFSDGGRPIGRARRRPSTRWRALKVAVFGYAMNGMGDIRVDEHSSCATLGPQIDSLAPGDLHACSRWRVDADAVARADRIREPPLRDRSAADRATSASSTRGCSSESSGARRGGYGAYTHPLRCDRRGRAVRRGSRSPPRPA